MGRNHKLKWEEEYNYLRTNGCIESKWLHKDSDEQWIETERIGEGILNYDASNNFPILNDGSSIIKFDSSSDNFNPPNNKSFYRLYFEKSFGDDALTGLFENFGFGALSYGIYYDLRSPDLDIEMTTEFDGFSSTKTLGGSSLTNIRYAGSPWWYDVNANKREPFQVYYPEEIESGANTPISKRNGRRVWNLKFSYLADTDIFDSNYMSNKYYEDSSSVSINDIYKDAGDKSDVGNYFSYTLE